MPFSQMTPVGIVLYSAGMFGELINAEYIDHTGPRPAAVEPGVTVEYGDYLVQVGECRVCHGLQLSGGKDPNPDAPFAPYLTRGGNLGIWSETDFIQTLRSGVNPSGHQLTEFIPWKFFGQMTDDELKAVWLYLQSLPALETTKSTGGSLTHTEKRTADDTWIVSGLLYPINSIGNTGRRDYLLNCARTAPAGKTALCTFT